MEILNIYIKTDMRFIADFHIHSKYSRATSKDMSPESIWRWAQLKGITVIGTGDFTHPAWYRELKDKLEPTGNGFFALKREFWGDDVPVSCRADISFVLSAEISCIYRKNGRTRKIHAVVLFPDMNAAARFNLALSRIGNLSADGRPILGLDAKELLRIAIDSSQDALFIPAHVWTPHFSVFGSESGFDTLEECFEDLTQYIYAIETGLSSDPVMNWRLSCLDRITLLSNSDAHSAPKIGREANIFETDLSYSAVTQSIKTREGFSGTIEFFPEEGKYHADGHRACGVRLSPKETLQNGFLCPVCAKRLTVGVMHRVEKLADREEGARPEGAPGYTSIIPLPEIIAEVLKAGPNTKKVLGQYHGMLEALGPEFYILMQAPLSDIERAGSPLLREAVARVREGRVNILPGYDGEYGKIRIFSEAEV